MKPGTYVQYLRDHDLPTEGRHDGPPEDTIAPPMKPVGRTMQAYLDQAAADLGITTPAPNDAVQVCPNCLKPLSSWELKRDYVVCNACVPHVSTELLLARRSEQPKE